MLEALAEAEGRGAALAIFPELALCGYPPKDLLERPAFVEAARASLDTLAAARAGGTTAALVGFPERRRDGRGARSLQQRRADRRRPGGPHRAQVAPADLRRVRRVALLRARRPRSRRSRSVDAGWGSRSARTSGTTPTSGRRGSTAPIRSRRSCARARRSSSISRPRPTRSKSAICARACWRRRRGDGAARCCSSTRSADRTTWCSTGPAWRSTRAARWSRAAPSIRAISSWSTSTPIRRSTPRPAIFGRSSPPTRRSALGALALGTRDYARRCGFSRALLGLSGGIDSALVACLAARALGPANVLGVAMPSRYSSPGSLADAEALAKNLGIDFTVVSIEPMFAAYLETLAPALERLRRAEHGAGRGGRRRSRPPRICRRACAARS